MATAIENLTIPSVDDYKLIELVRQNKPLYDKNHPDYRDLIKKNIIWKAISVALATPEEACRKRFRCLRDRFNKERKVRKDSMLTDPSVPAIFKKMLFLWEFCTHRRKTTNYIKYRGENPNEAETLKKELDKQYRILKGEELSDDDDVDDVSDDNDTNEHLSNNMVMVLDEEEEKNSEEHDKDKQGVYCTYVIANSSYHESDVPIQPAHIIFVPSENGSEKNNEDVTTSQPTKIIIMPPPPPHIETDNTNEQINKEVQSSDGENAHEENSTGEHEQSNNDNIDENGAENDIASDQKTDKAASLNISNIILSTKSGHPRKRKRLHHNIIHLNKNNVTETEKLSKSKTVAERVIAPAPTATSGLTYKKVIAAAPTAESALTHKKVIASAPTAESVLTYKPSCNDAFCSIVKNYLDKITTPERLSSARLQILTILHNELYSTYT